MRFRFYIDRETGQPHPFNHGVTEAEAINILVRPIEDRPGLDDSRVAIGRTPGGRFLKVIYTLNEDGSLFVITAYGLIGKPLVALRRRMRRRGR